MIFNAILVPRLGFEHVEEWLHATSGEGMTSSPWDKLITQGNVTTWMQTTAFISLFLTLRKIQKHGDNLQQVI